jgi:[amino group carrier protein]-L-2-aminoadipate 6-kinase
MAGGGVDTVVVKCGGAPSLHRDTLAADVADLIQQGKRVVLVHGGGPEADRLMRELGRTPQHVVTPSGASSRRTDAGSLDALMMAFAGRVRPALIAQLDRLGVPAVGLTGMDGGLVEARQKPALKVVDEEGRTRLVRGDLSGRVTSVRSELLELLCSSGYVPVVSPPVRGDGDTPLNVDADRLAATLAGALDAEALVLLTDAPGVLRDPDDPATLVQTASAHEDLLDYARGRMKLKVVAAGEALAGGVATVAIADGRHASPVEAALAGEGTLLRAEPSAAESLDAAAGSLT